MAELIKEGEWESLRHFINWWWRAGSPYKVPEDCVRRHEGSHEFVLYRCNQFQIEQVTLFPGYSVPVHSHPDVDTCESHIVGGGTAYVEGVRVPTNPDPRHEIKYRRLNIPAGV